MKSRNPRHGSMQFWPRKRAVRPTPRVRSWADGSGLLAFPGYKAGMTHVVAVDADRNSPTKGETIAVPATIIECPPLKIYSVRAYGRDIYGLKVVSEIVLGKDKNLLRRLFTKKAHGPESLDKMNSEGVVDITVLVFTQPSLTGIGKKKPEILEFHIGGSVADKISFIKDHLASGIRVADVFKEGDYVDARAVTKGKGYQGSVKRFGVSLTSHKSEKKRRGPGSLGGWKSNQHWQYRVAFPGQMGYHQRTQYNSQIIKIGNDPSLVNPDGGLIRYGLVRNDFLLVRGSVPGSKKRLVVLTKGLRVKKHKTIPTVEAVSTRSHQRR